MNQHRHFWFHKKKTKHLTHMIHQSSIREGKYKDQSVRVDDTVPRWLSRKASQPSRPMKIHPKFQPRRELQGINHETMTVDDNVPRWLSQKASQPSRPIKQADCDRWQKRHNTYIWKFASGFFVFLVFVVPCTCQDRQ